MANIVSRRLHVIVDDTEEIEDADYDIAPPVTYSSRGAPSHDDRNHHHRPRGMMYQHRQQYHQYDPNGRFEGNASSRHYSKGHHDFVGRLPSQSVRQGEMFCCCFAPAGSVPRCCMDAASCNGSNFGEPSATTEDGVLLQTELIAFQKAALMTRTIGAMVIKRQAATINCQLLQLQQQQGQEDDCLGTSRPDDTGYLLNHDDEASSARIKRRRVEQDTTEPLHARLKNEKKQTVERGMESPTSLQVAAPTQQAIPTSNGSYCNTSHTHESLLNTGTDGNVSTTSTNATINSSNTHCADKAAIQIWYQVDRMKRMSMFLKNAQIAQSLLHEEMKECFHQHSAYPEGEGVDMNVQQHTSEKQAEVDLEEANQREEDTY